ncbi:hypothetical protein SDC9_116133 [bioreactor metagenome]|uniref:Uncharacterized protein n=1 Tax=bioreactor metagenome TaxID=1076179 RepID=A0A645BUS7_9ZZZZ
MLHKLCLILLSFMVIVIGGCGDNSFKTQPEYKKMETAIQQQQYEKAKEYLNTAFEKQKQQNKPSREDDLEKAVIGNYIFALECQKQGSIYQAYKSLNRIPKDYKGAYASEVKSLLYVAEKDYNREAQKTLDIRNKKFLNIGDAEGKIYTIYGEPENINTITKPQGEMRQFVYKNGLYVYVLNGWVYSIQSPN